MKRETYILAKQICQEMGIEWKSDAKYATIGDIELREYLTTHHIFDVEEEPYRSICVKNESNSPVCYSRNMDTYVLAA